MKINKNIFKYNLLFFKKKKILMEIDGKYHKYINKNIDNF
jgi:hypothetical protein